MGVLVYVLDRDDWGCWLDYLEHIGRQELVHYSNWPGVLEFIDECRDMILEGEMAPEAADVWAEEVVRDILENEGLL